MNKLLLLMSSLMGDRELRKPEDSGLWGSSLPLLTPTGALSVQGGQLHYLHVGSKN